MVLEILFISCIILYWISEGVTEGYTWASQKQRLANKLIHPNAAHNGLMDYHGWRLFENIGIWGAVIIAYFTDMGAFNFFTLGIGAWFVGASLYEMALNYIVSVFIKTRITSGTYLGWTFNG
jgi:hypothetical protein